MATEARSEAAPRRGQRSRREVLAGAAGALGVIAAQTVGRATPAQAGVDGDVVLGVDEQSTGGTTGVSTTSGTGLHGRAPDSFGTGVLGQGDTGVEGQGHTYGVFGLGSTYGVWGAGGTYGVYGNGSGGVYGTGSNSNGVFGETDVAAASGVYGQNNTTGYGVAGRSNNGTGVLADSINGTALKVTGKASFSRSGKATVKAGNSQVAVKNVALTTESLVLATLQQVETGIYVAGVVQSVANSKFTIVLNQAPTGALKVAWFVVN